MIDQTERAILLALEPGDGGGTNVWLICSKMPEDIGPQVGFAQWVGQRLVGLEKRGLVCRLDDRKPIAWKRTAEGTATLD